MSVFLSKSTRSTVLVVGVLLTLGSTGWSAESPPSTATPMVGGGIPRDLPPPPPCNLVAGTNECLGLLTPGFANNPNNPNADELFRVEKKATTKSKESKRKTDCLGGGCRPNDFQNGITYVNKDSRRFTPKGLLGDAAIVIGSIEWKHGYSYGDNYYKVGKRLDGFGSRNRTIFVAHAVPSGTTPTSPYGTVIAAWTLYGYVEGGTELKGVSTGWIVDCNKPHNDPSVYSGFFGCVPERLYRQASATTKIPFEDLLNAAHCSVSMLDFPNAATESVVSVDDQCNRQRRNNFRSLQKRYAALTTDALLKLLTAFGSEELDSYWFPCASGCCTADTP